MDAVVKSPSVNPFTNQSFIPTQTDLDNISKVFDLIIVIDESLRDSTAYLRETMGTERFHQVHMFLQHEIGNATRRIIALHSLIARSFVASLEIESKSVFVEAMNIHTHLSKIKSSLKGFVSLGCVADICYKAGLQFIRRLSEQHGGV